MRPICGDVRVVLRCDTRGLEGMAAAAQRLTHAWPASPALDPMDLPRRPVTGGLASTLILGAALAAAGPATVSRRAFLGMPR